VRRHEIFDRIYGFFMATHPTNTVYIYDVKYQQISENETQKYQGAAFHKLRRTLNATIKLVEKKINQ